MKMISDKDFLPVYIFEHYALFTVQYLWKVVEYFSRCI